MDTSNFVTSSDLTAAVICLFLLGACAIYLVHSVAQERADLAERNIRMLDAENAVLREELERITAHMNGNFALLSEQIRPLASLHDVGVRALRGRQAIADADEEIASIERQVVRRIDRMRREEEAMHAYVEEQVGEIRGRLATFR